MKENAPTGDLYSRTNDAYNASRHREDDGIVFAAQAAATALSERDAAVAAHRCGQIAIETGIAGAETGQMRLICRICGRGDEDGRPMLRFLPVTHDMEVADAAPSVVTFSEDIALHVFCGKTASILPTGRPDLEILTKAGLKNKHGIGAEVNAALARTRCARLTQEGSKDKVYFLVREFEAHLAVIRDTSITFATPQPPTIPLTQVHHNHPLQPQHQHQQESPSFDIPHHHSLSHLGHPASFHASHDNGDGGQRIDDIVHHSLSRQHDKQLPVRAAAGKIRKPKRNRSRGENVSRPQNSNGVGNGIDVPDDNLSVSSHDPACLHGNQSDIDDSGRAGLSHDINGFDMNGIYDRAAVPFGSELSEDGTKIRCSCGGTHLPPGTPKGSQSWRNHVMTSRHQKWMETNGLLGPV